MHDTGDYDISRRLRQPPSYAIIVTTQMTSVLLSEVGRGEAGYGATIVAVPLTPEEVGERIAIAREGMTPKPWSQFDLALAMGVSPSTIYRWEKGRLPSMSELIRLAEVLEQPVDYFTEPPEHRAQLGELHALLAEARDEAERGRSALIALLSSLDARLSHIEDALDLPDGRDSEARS
jgi:transcriptional regulator with XRE-family HTH domain